MCKCNSVHGEPSLLHNESFHYGSRCPARNRPQGKGGVILSEQSSFGYMMKTSLQFLKES